MAFKRRCLKTRTIVDGDRRLVLIYGRDYFTTRTIDGRCRVWSSYLVWVPTDWFGPARPAFSEVLT